ncbi:hypothetical protein ASPVEDRAFT_132872 [Aspergillus versicolor CBS 583.65]|uniref:C2H2-type domain-containing protein n=1 Tax=Aspergillus versicolor CBS 583.65 TaxID=1036611 RepID=A0A1L9PMH6_ASPVE|nr:uncharacterized protein ASPVEDRAFT_132872 [Aspergillus versicolor CBS 583.65]OJJ02744.1 hypothetical protein ASPVEDRAFT_132872 [Aspergillus versicolor CBS 583.65]
MAPGSGRDFNCSWEHCGKSFNRKSDLCRHYRIHTNERPYQCNFRDCHKSFIQRSALTVHSRTHTGEKPHVCDHEGCHKAFSDSSSLARHRRIHTGKRPYICQEPACERSFCRKTTLTKHQHRSHPPGSLARTPSEDAISEHSYPTPVTSSHPNEQYLLTQQAYYPNASTPTHEFYTHQNLPMRPVTMQEQPPIVTHSIPVTSSVEVHHAQQFMHMIQQQQQQQQQQHHHHHHHHQQRQQQQQHQGYDPHRMGFVPVEYQQPVFTSPTVESHPYIPPYASSLECKTPVMRLLDQPEGTDFAFLGTGC